MHLVMAASDQASSYGHVDLSNSLQRSKEGVRSGLSVQGGC